MYLKTLWIGPEVHMVYNAKWITVPGTKEGERATDKWVREDKNEPSLNLYFQSGRLRVRHAQAANATDIAWADIIKVAGMDGVPLEKQP